MKKYVVILCLLAISVSSLSQQLKRPKLVVGIVVDQMRWDYLYRYHQRYAENGGFKRLMNKGFNCNNTLIPYTPTYTACGHASIYTGSVPAINGITGNNWFDNELQRNVYCTEDESRETVGSTTLEAGKMSPANMFTTTICDELKLATNFRSKVIGVALKDRGGILSAGHSADAAYWYDNKTGNWITSTYYMNVLPAWVTEFNQKKMVDEFYKQGWNTLYPVTSYTQSTTDENNFEVQVLGKSFPYVLAPLTGRNYSLILSTPYGNTLTTLFSKLAIEKEQLGADSITDFLAVSYSSPDYIGHAYAPNSIEVEDTYLRLDKELGEMLDYLDAKIGKDEYVVFLSADHGAAHNTKFMKQNKMPAGNVLTSKIGETVNRKLKQKFGEPDLILDIINFQVILNLPKIKADRKLNLSEIKEEIIELLEIEPSVLNAFSLEDLGTAPLNSTLKNMIANGFYKKRSGQIQIVLKPQWLEGFENGGTTHGLWNPYDTHIPLLWYGFTIKPGLLNREVYMTDIAATLAALLHIQAPNGSIGKVIEEVLR